MPISLTTEELRKSISKEIIFNPFLIEQVSVGIDTIEADKQALQTEDNLNKMFMDKYHIDIAKQYETERENLNGYTSTTFTETDISEAVNPSDPTVGSLFFPIDPLVLTNTWSYYIPKIVDEVNGIGGSTNTNYEQRSVSDVELLAQFISTGFNYGTGTTTLTNPYTPGDGTMVVGVNSFNDGEHIYVGDGIFEITAGGGTNNLTVYELVPPSGTIAAPPGPIPPQTTVYSTFGGFSDADRTSMSTSGDQNILNSLAAQIDTAVSTWKGYLNDENAAIAANLEDRVTQVAQLSTATSNNNTVISSLVAWESLSFSSVNPLDTTRFNDAGLGALTSTSSIRSTQITNRISEINTALGSVSDGGDGTFSGATGDIYYERYKWLDARINKIYGSAGGADQKDKAKAIVQSQVDNLQLKIDEFGPYMTVTTFTVGTEGPDEQEDNTEPTNILEVNSIDGFSEGDGVYVASDKKPEIETKILYIDSTNNTFTFSTEIPLGYTIFDNARVYKVL